MVSVRQDPVIGSFAAQLQNLKAIIANGWHPESPESGFVEWLVDRTSTSLDSSWESFDPGAVPGNRWSEAPILAAAGFRMASVSLVARHLKAWLDGMQRLATRDPIPVDRNSFLFRPLELLGLVIGSLVVTEHDSTPSDWLRRIVRENIKQLAVTTFWNRGLTLLTVERLGLRDALTLEPRHPQDSIDAALAVTFSLIDQAVLNRLSTLAGEVLEQTFLSQAALTQPEVSGVAQAAAYAIALKVSVLHAVGALSAGPNTAADLVCDLARHFPVFVSELTKRHGSRVPLEVKDEYDVQDLFRAALRLHFRDVRKEEWNPSYGGVQSRSDLLLKPERIVVETKMTRQGLGQREVVEELTIDKAHYRGHPNCRTLVCFIYDPDRRLGNPGAIEMDLAERTEVLDVRVVVSPNGL
jgi:hypothetical protein